LCESISTKAQTVLERRQKIKPPSHPKQELGNHEENVHTMRNRAFRSIAAILSVLILAGTPAHAGPVALSEVIQVLGSYQNAPDLRLRNVSQNSGIKESRQSTSLRQSTNGGDPLNIPDFSIGASTNGTPDTILSGVFVNSGEQQTGVDVIAQDDVEGTVCDCGEIAVPGGFPKWPLLFLAAIPFFFIHHHDDCDHCETPTPTPNPTPAVRASIPEPASLLLFASGLAALGAGLRRRYAKGKLALQIQATEEG
jgi:hypothetical protein